MKLKKTPIKDLLILEPKIFMDDRGSFMESWNKNEFEALLSIDYLFVQDNFSVSKKNVLRGLHYQINRPQGKLVRVVSGEVLDVALDLRINSKTFGHHYSIKLSDKNNKQLWIPPGFAHGFYVMSQEAKLSYKTTDYYFPDYERCIIWNDPELNINWQLSQKKPSLSTKDSNGSFFTNASVFEDL